MAKAVKKQGLGRGLSAILKDPDNDIKSVEDTNADKVVGNIIELELDTIKVNPFQPRTNFNEEESIRRFSQQLRSLGVEDLLREQGIQSGDTVNVYEFEFEFLE